MSVGGSPVGSAYSGNYHKLEYLILNHLFRLGSGLHQTSLAV
jgi:hypothetical protein